LFETEAYVVGDAAGHAYRGMMTPRNRSLFSRRGACLVRVYGSAYMLNLSSEIAGLGWRPHQGRLTARRHSRSGSEIVSNRAAARPWREDTGRPHRRVADDHRLDGLDLCPAIHDRRIGVSIRIGIARGSNRLLRFYLREQSVRQRSQRCLGNKDRITVAPPL